MSLEEFNQLREMLVVAIGAMEQIYQNRCLEEK
jgi:hypothetical protein